MTNPHSGSPASRPYDSGAPVPAAPRFQHDGPPPGPVVQSPGWGVNAEGQLAQLQRQQMAESRYQDQRKSEGIAYLLWFFTGILGGHRFYARSTGVALGMLFTLGGLGLWAVIDVFFIGRRIKNVNADIRRDVYGQYGLPVA